MTATADQVTPAYPTPGSDPRELIAAAREQVLERGEPLG